MYIQHVILFFISAATHYMMLHNRKDPAVFDGNYLLGAHWRASDAKKHYLKEAVNWQKKFKTKNQFHEFFSSFIFNFFKIYFS